MGYILIVWTLLILSGLSLSYFIGLRSLYVPSFEWGIIPVMVKRLGGFER